LTARRRALLRGRPIFVKRRAGFLSYFDDPKVPPPTASRPRIGLFQSSSSLT